MSRKNVRVYLRRVVRCHSRVYGHGKNEHEKMDMKTFIDMKKLWTWKKWT